MTECFKIKKFRNYLKITKLRIKNCNDSIHSC